MRKIFLGLVLIINCLYSEIYKEKLILELKEYNSYSIYKCEKKQSKWYQFDTEKDKEIDDNCGGVDKTVRGFNSFKNNFNIKKDLIVNLPVKFSIVKVNFHHVSFTYKIYENYPTIDFLEKIEDVYEIEYSLHIDNPIKNKNLVYKNHVKGNKPLKIIYDKNIDLKTYTNTYDIDDIRECIDGKIWVKKYGKMSGDKCDWIETEKI